MLETRHIPATRPGVPLFAGTQALFDEDGFLLDHEQWNEALAERIAQRDGVGPLDEKHWRLLRHVRDRYLELGGMPGMRRVCRATGMSRDDIYALFGGCLPVWRVAGLPNPGEEAKAYLD